MQRNQSRIPKMELLDYHPLATTEQEIELLRSAQGRAINNGFHTRKMTIHYEYAIWVKMKLEAREIGEVYSYSEDACNGRGVHRRST